MSVERETYTELLHSMMFAWVEGQLSLPQVASVLYATAQPDTEETTTDVTHEVRRALTDWSEMNKGMLLGVETVLLTFNCVNVHGVCAKGKHTVAMTRVIGSMGWEPEEVSSQHDFSKVVLDATMAHHPDQGTREGKVVSNISNRGAIRDLIGTFRDMFMQQPEQKMEKEIDEFRAELDKLFPSTPGKEEGHESS